MHFPLYVNHSDQKDAMKNTVADSLFVKVEVKREFVTSQIRSLPEEMNTVQLIITLEKNLSLD